MNTYPYRNIVAGATFALFTTIACANSTVDNTQSQSVTHPDKEEIASMSVEDFGSKYVDLWKTTDDAERKVLIEELFTEDAQQHVVPANMSFENRDAILANVTKVNSEAIQKAGLKFKLISSTPNHDAILVEWAAETPNGQVAQSGRDFLILNGEGKATVLYMHTSQ